MHRLGMLSFVVAYHISECISLGMINWKYMGVGLIMWINQESVSCIV